MRTGTEFRVFVPCFEDTKPFLNSVKITFLITVDQKTNIKKQLFTNWKQNNMTTGSVKKPKIMFIWKHKYSRLSSEKLVLFPKCSSYESYRKKTLIINKIKCFLSAPSNTFDCYLYFYSFLLVSIAKNITVLPSL